MAGILKTRLRVLSAENFLDQMNASNGIENIPYLMIGKESVWPNENLPPAPIDTIDEEQLFYTDLNSAIRIQTNEVSMVVPRIDWTSGQEYDLFDNASDLSYASNFYVRNSNNEVYKVETKVGVNPVVVAEPVGHGGGSPIDTGDGYTWSFLYEITPINAERFLTANWMPVAWDDSETSNQALFGDTNPQRVLGAKWMMFYAKISNTGIIPTNITYRKTGLVMNPYETGGTVLATASEYLTASLEPDSGQIVYIEHRRPIVRDPSQIEEIKLIIAF